MAAFLMGIDGGSHKSFRGGKEFAAFTAYRYGWGNCFGSCQG